MILAWLAAGLAFASSILYSHRLGYVWYEREWADRIMACAVSLLIIIIGFAFIDVANQQDTLLTRQKWTLVGLIVLTVSLIWPRRRVRRRVHAPNTRDEKPTIL